MFDFGFSLMPLIIQRAIEENARVEEMLASMPKEEADKLREKMQKQREAKEAHQRALEIAEAGRARNFWGQ